MQDQDVKFLDEIIKLAGEKLMSFFGTSLKVDTKADASLVTEADLASERVLIDGISRAYPHDIICSEESGLSSADRTPGRYIWILDPLDGTTNFAHGYPYFCVSVGRGRFREDGSIEMRLGGIEDPVRKKSYVAKKEHGAFVNRLPMKVRRERPLKESFLVTGFYYATGDLLSREIDRFHRVAQICSSIRRDGAAALDLALVAEGVFDAFWEYGLKPWDVAAGSLLIQEAGGVVLNYHQPIGTEFNVEADGVLGGTGQSVKEILKMF